MSRGSDLRAAARDGRRLRGRFLDVRVAVRQSGQSRIGLVVPKHGQSAVRRNRLKRILRELIRLQILEALRAAAAGSAMDILIRALPTAYRASSEQLGEVFEELRPRLLRAVDTAGDAGSGESGTPPPR